MLGTYQRRQSLFGALADTTSFKITMEILRQGLICDADTGFIIKNWIDRRKIPWRNHNTLHECRNIDGKRESSRKNDVPALERYWKGLMERRA